MAWNERTMMPFGNDLVQHHHLVVPPTHLHILLSTLTMITKEWQLFLFFSFET